MTGLKHHRLSPGALSLALLLALLWAGNPISIKIGLADCPPLRLGWMRFVLGASVVLTFALVRKQSLRVQRGELPALLAVGFLFTSQLAFLNIGQDRTSAGHAVVIMSTHPIWVAILAHFIVPGDRLSRQRVVGAGCAYLGVVVVLSASLRGSGPYSIAGDGMLICSALLLAIRQIVLSQSLQGVGIPKLLLSQAALGTFCFVIASHVFESEPTSYTANLGVALFYQGVIIAGFAFILHAWLLKRFLPSRVTMVFLIQPLFGVALSALILGEGIGPELVAGAPLVALGSYLVQRS